MRLARVGDSDLLEQAVNAAANLDDYLAPLLAAGEAMRSEAPSDSSDVLRAWKPLSAATRIDGDAHLWWVRGEIVQAELGGDLDWQIEAASERNGDWTEVAYGDHDPNGKGNATWKVTEMASLLGLADDLGTLSISYDDDGTDDGSRLIEFEVDEPLGTPRLWTVAGEVVLGWTSDLQVTDDGLTWPAAAQVFHVDGDGGRANGVFYKELDVPLSFQSCWDWQGDLLWLKGDEDISGTGGPASCTVEDIF